MTNAFMKVAVACQGDNGPEFCGKALDAWVFEHGVLIDFSRPRKPSDNGHDENFNGKFRDECLNQDVFLFLYDARRVVEFWRQDYNSQRPHSSVAGSHLMSPAQRI